MLDMAVYYIEAADSGGYSTVRHHDVEIGRFATRDIAISMARHLASSACDLGLTSQVIEFKDATHAAVVFQGTPEPEFDLNAAG